VEYSYLNDMLVMLAATALAVALCLRMQLSPILAYLAVGVIVGPFGTGLVSDVEHIRIFAEFGVVFLLFSIGLEFSVALLIRMKAAVLGLGSAQVWLTAAITAAVAFCSGSARKVHWFWVVSSRCHRLRWSPNNWRIRWSFTRVTAATVWVSCCFRI